MTTAWPPPRELTRHAGAMLLIDRVVESSGNRQRTETTVTAANPFFVAGRGLPSYVGFEMMAQSISIFDGLLRRENNEAPAIGFLLGCRRYRVTRDWFEQGERLLIDVISLIEEGEMRSFDCRILGPGEEEFASGSINVYRPDDPQAYLEQARAHG